MNNMMRVCGVLAAVTLAGSVCMADPYNRGDYHGDRGDRGRSDHGNDGGSHYGYYHNSRGDLVFGLIGLGILAAVVSADRPVYVERPVVVSQPPQVIYVQQPPPAPVRPPPPVTITVSIQNSNGSFTPVTLRQAGTQWLGPKGEYYDAVPSVGQLRPVYGF